MSGRRYAEPSILALVAVAMAAGSLLGFRAPGGPSWLLLLPAAAGAGTLAWRAAAAAPAGMFLALFAAVGVGLGHAAAAGARADCRARIPDGARLEVRALLAARPAAEGGTSLWLIGARVAGRDLPCRGEVRARVPAPTGAGIAAGESLIAWGRWWASPRQGAWPRGGHRTGVLVVDSVKVAGPSAGPRARVYAARGGAQDRLRRLFGERAPMAEALILAQRDGLDPALRDRFVRAGLIHLLAISGLHVGLVAGSLLLLGRILRLAHRPAAILAAGATLAYVLFLGAPHAAARAGLQVLLVLVARMLQRPANPYALLAAAALVLLAVDPLALMEPGFQLSFGGVAGIIALRRRLVDAVPGDAARPLRDAMATNVAATATTLPLAAFHFGQIAPVGLVANLAAVPIMAATVPALALALAASFVSWPLAEFLSGAGSALLAAFEAVAARAAAIPGGNGYAARGTVLAWSAAVVSAIFAARRLAPGMRPLARRAAAAGVALALVLFWPAGGRLLDHGALEIHVIDVGQGDAYAIRSPAGRWLLVDTGPRSPVFDAGRARVVPYLLRHNARRVEAIVLTHPDADHVGGTGAVLDAFPVNVIIDPALPAGKPLFLTVIGGARREGVRWLAAQDGREFRFDGVVLRFLFPDGEILDASQDANDLSVVFRLTYGRFAALFMGDALADAERILVRRHGGDLRAHVLKVGHHGSATSTTPELLDAVAPEIALISVGRRNRYGHPAPDVLQRLHGAGVRVLRTDVHGAIRLRAEADGRVEVWTGR